MRGLDVVVGRDRTTDCKHFSAYFFSELLLHITLSFILLPVLGWHEFEVLEHVHIWVLPHVLDSVA